MISFRIVLASLLLASAAQAQQTQSTINPNVPAVGSIVEQSGPQFRANFQAAISDINVLFSRASIASCSTVGGLTPCFTGTQQPSGVSAAPFAILNGLFATNWNVNAGANNIAYNGTQVIINGTSAQAGNGGAMFGYATDLQFTSDAGIANRSAYASFLARALVNQNPTATNFYIGGENCNVAAPGVTVWPVGSQLVCQEADIGVSAAGLTGRAIYKAVLADSGSTSFQGTGFDAVLYATTVPSIAAFGMKNGILFDGTGGKIIATNGCVLCLGGVLGVTTGINLAPWSISGNAYTAGCVAIAAPPACDAPSTPAMRVDANGRIYSTGQASASLPAFINSNSFLQMVGSNGGFPGVTHYGYNGGFGQDVFFFSSGNLGAEAVPQIGNTMGNLGYRGWNGSAYTSNVAALRIDAPVTWIAGTSYPTVFRMLTITPGTTAPLNVAFQVYAGVVIGSGTTDPGAGNLTIGNNIFSALSTPAAGTLAYITDALAANCGDAACTAWATTITGGGGALKRLAWYNGTNWTLIGR